MSRKTEQRYITEQADFPTNLRELMKEHNVTQKVLAEVIEMRPQTVSLYIGGQSVPDINTLYKIAEYFNVSADWLIGRPGSTKTVNENIQTVCKTTGLSENAVLFFDLLKDSPSGKRDAILRTVNALLSVDRFFENYEYWEKISLYLYTHSKPFWAPIGSTGRVLDEEKVLSILLEENNEYLKELRKGAEENAVD